MTAHTLDTRALLRERAQEVVVYLRFMRVAVERDAVVMAAGGAQRRALSKDLTHTLKANLYLLMYSTVEACMTQLLEDMHRAIDASGAGADDLYQALLLHVLQQFRGGAVSTSANTSTPIHACIVRRWLADYAQAVTLNKNNLFSGNLDGRSIHGILQKYGVVSSTKVDPDPQHTHRSLQTAKDNRNDLAHGSKSFRELGRTVGVPTLEEEARHALRTLHRIVLEVDGYLIQKRFLRTPPPPPAVPAPQPPPA